MPEQSQPGRQADSEPQQQSGEETSEATSATRSAWELSRIYDFAEKMQKDTLKIVLEHGRFDDLSIERVKAEIFVRAFSRSQRLLEDMKIGVFVESSVMSMNEQKSDKIYTDLSIAAAEARTDTKFAALKGTLDVVSANVANFSGQIALQRSEAASGRTTLIVTIVTSAIATVTIILAVLSYGAATFYNGTVVKDMVDHSIAEHATAPSQTPEPKK